MEGLKMAKKTNKSYFDRVHSWGRISTVTALCALLMFPIGICLYLNVFPPINGILAGLLKLIPTYWTVAVVEVIVYTPMLGAGGTYLSFVTGNIANLKLPCAINALENAKVDAKSEEGEASKARPMRFREIFAIKGAIPCFITFFTYCSLELSTSLWASSYLVQKWNFSPEAAAGFVCMFYLGLTLGRFANGFLAMRLGDHFLIRMGTAIISFGVVLMLLPFHSSLALAGFAVIGLGCAPIYPCIIHSTPEHFGAENAQALIGIQMASAYVGICVMPPLFGLIANHISAGLLPWYLAAINAVMILMCERLNKISSNK